MFKLRSEVTTVARACEHLISETMMKGYPKLTDDECQVVEYYAGELLKVTQTESATTASANAMEPLLSLVRFSGPLGTAPDDLREEPWPPCTVASRQLFPAEST